METYQPADSESRFAAPDGEIFAEKTPPAVWALRMTYVLAAAAVFVGLYLSSLYSYPLFHSLAEIFSIVIGFMIFIIAWNGRRYMTSDYLLLIGVSFLFISIIDIVHMLAYKGMGVFPSYDSNLPTQLWIAARYIESLSLLVAPLFIARKLDLRVAMPIYAVVTTALLVLIFGRRFPACYVEGEGLTQFKVISEYVISFILACALALLVICRRSFDRTIFLLLAVAIAATILSELAFTHYLGVYDFFNLAGHMLKILAFALFYAALVRTCITKPFSMLFREVGRRNKELALYGKQLEQSNRELEAFSYSVSHDLRGPLTAIDGYSTLVLQDYGDQLGPEGRGELQRVRDASAKMAEMIEDILKLSRASRSELVRETSDLSAVVVDISNDLKACDPGRRVDFVIEPNVEAICDPTLLRIVLDNLIRNAWKFTGKHATAEIGFGVTDTPRGRSYYVRDDGAGFDMKYAGKLFNPFRRLHDESDFPGTGIGLATVRRVVNRHGGEIWAEADVEKGATFYFTLGDEDR